MPLKGKLCLVSLTPTKEIKVETICYTTTIVNQLFIPYYILLPDLLKFGTQNGRLIAEI